MINASDRVKELIQLRQDKIRLMQELAASKETREITPDNEKVKHFIDIIFDGGQLNNE